MAQDLSPAQRTLTVGVLGAGTVGSQVIRLLTEQADDFAARSGARLEITGVAVRDVNAPRDFAVPQDLLTDDATAVATGNDLVIELIGGIEPARTLILAAFKAGASVITGNKALIAAHGPELYTAAAAAGTDFYYEAAVAGAIPVVYALRESMAGDRVTSVLGIVNGTTNYILDEMSTKGLSFETALATAQELGYAEADPTADVDGLDARQSGDPQLPDDDAAAQIHAIAIHGVGLGPPLQEEEGDHDDDHGQTPQQGPAHDAVGEIEAVGGGVPVGVGQVIDIADGDDRDEGSDDLPSLQER